MALLRSRGRLSGAAFLVVIPHAASRRPRQIPSHVPHLITGSVIGRWRHTTTTRLHATLMSVNSTCLTVVADAQTVFCDSARPNTLVRGPHQAANLCPAVSVLIRTSRRAGQRIDIRARNTLTQFGHEWTQRTTHGQAAQAGALLRGKIAPLADSHQGGSCINISTVSYVAHSGDMHKRRPRPACSDHRRRRVSVQDAHAAPAQRSGGGWAHVLRPREALAADRVWRTVRLSRQDGEVR
jgi:hypothetical protein